MQVDINWYLNQQPKQHVITLPTCTIPNPKLEVNTVIDFHAILQAYVPGHKQKKSNQDSLYV